MMPYGPQARLRAYFLDTSTEGIVEATTNDLRSRTKDLLETVNNGEEIIITYHGKPCAKLVPYFETPQSATEGIFALLSGNVPAPAH